MSSYLILLVNRVGSHLRQSLLGTYSTIVCYPGTIASNRYFAISGICSHHVVSQCGSIGSFAISTALHCYQTLQLNILKRFLKSWRETCLLRISFILCYVLIGTWRSIFIIIFSDVLIDLHFWNFLVAVHHPLRIIWPWNVRWVCLIWLSLEHNGLLHLLSFLQLDLMTIEVYYVWWNLWISTSLAIFEKLRVIEDHGRVGWDMSGIDISILIWLDDGILLFYFLFRHVWVLSSNTNSGAILRLDC
jgi:hypothetical protein